jgi:hypothetical protein
MFKDTSPQKKIRETVEILAIIGVILSLSATTNNVYAQQTNWISVSSVRDLTGNVQLQGGQPLLAGHSYNVTMMISVPFSQAISNFQITLDSAMSASGPQFWYLLSSKYGGYNASTFVPGSKTITFKQVEGKLNLTALFTIPSDITTTVADGISLRFSKDDFQVITVKVTGGSTVGEAAFRISDSAIEAYLDTYSKKTSLIPSGKIDQVYSTLVNDIAQQSQDLYKIGLPEKATDLLNTIDPSLLPTPPNTSYVTLLLAGVVAFAAIAAVLALIYIRGRSRHGFTLAVVGDAQRELAGLEVTAARYDKNLAEQLKNLRDKLGEGS